MHHRFTLCFLLLVAAATSVAAQEPSIRKTSWGRIVPVRGAGEPDEFVFEVERPPADGRLVVPTPFPNIVQCRLDSNGSGQSGSGQAGSGQKVDFEFNRDASELKLWLPELAPSTMPAERPSIVRVTTSEKSRQLSDGRILLGALDAQVVGDTARLESHPGNHRIGFWTDADDYVTWDYPASRWGMYDVWLTYSTASPSGGRVEVRLAKDGEPGAAVSARLDSTGSWYRYTTRRLGKLYLPTAGKHAVSVKCLEKTGGAVMNLKAVLFVPACEGTPPVQADNDVVTLHARDATVRGTMLRWEPAEKKRTLGYWVRPDDRASWICRIDRPGTFDVEVLQGCGMGQGGSRMRIAAAGQDLDWVVEETGHFQNFKPRIVGRLAIEEAGSIELTVSCTKLANKAACDLRQIRLVPAE